MSLPDPLAGLSAAEQARVVAAMSEPMLRDWAATFPAWAHRGQLAPAGDWRTWVIMGGRGFGKTRAGAEWVLDRVRTAAAPAQCRIALVGATIDDARAVMVEGTSGLLACARGDEIGRWSPVERRLDFANGAQAALFSGRSPGQLRGPEHDFAWADELGKWKHAQAGWDMLQMGLRRGDHPRCVVTTTPSPEPVLARLIAAADSVVTGGATRANPHLPASFVAAVEAAYGGTRLGRQEIEGVLLCDREGSLWPGALVERCRGRGLSCGEGTLADHPWTRVVIGVDPPASAAGCCGIVVAALARDGSAWVLADASVAGASPEGWARAVAGAAAAWGADRVVAEVNQGGAMVGSVLKAAQGDCPSGAGGALPLKLVHAARGKVARAEPVAALFEAGRAWFAGVFPALEAELAGFTAGGYAGQGSPDRADAMVWALWALCLDGRPTPGVRVT